MNRREHLLTILAEEAAEIAQAASKCLRFSPGEFYKDRGCTNAENVVAEIHDLMTLVEMLHVEGVLPRSTPEEKSAAREAKRHKVEHYLRYSATCGTVTP